MKKCPERTCAKELHSYKILSLNSEYKLTEAATNKGKVPQRNQRFFVKATAPKVRSIFALKETSRKWKQKLR